MATLLEEWHSLAYESVQTNPKENKKVWDKYFAKEKEIYKQILKEPEKEISGKVSDLAEEYNMELVYFIGFLEGINESLKKMNPVEKLKADSKIKILIDTEDLYYNMVQAKADWLYNLPEWDNILTKEKRQELYKKCKSANTIKNEEKIYPNDPCPCGSGKKYKKCCGKNLY